MSTKIEALAGYKFRALRYGDLFADEEVNGVSRLVVGLDGGHEACLLELTSRLGGPFQMLYVLHTSRTNAELGRYESPEVSRGELEGFLQTFGTFLSEDSRHDIWLRSHGDDATVVLDRHSLIYAYGPLGAFEQVLQSLGVKRGAVPMVPAPHVHHYHAEWDDAERQVVRHFNWKVSPLHPSDVQFAEP